MLGSLVVLGDMSLGGSIIPADNMAASLQLAFDAGGKRVLLPMSSVGDIPHPHVSGYVSPWMILKRAPSETPS